MANRIYKKAIGFIFILAILMSQLGWYSLGYAATNIDLIIAKTLEVPENGIFYVEYTYTDKDGESIKQDKSITYTEYQDILASEEFKDSDSVRIQVASIDDATDISDQHIKINYETPDIGYKVLDIDTQDTEVYVGYRETEDGTQEEYTTQIIDSETYGMCKCTVVIDKVYSLNDRVSAASEIYTTDLAKIRQLVEYHVDCTDCTVHTENTAEITKLTLKEEQNGKGEITSDIFKVEGFKEGKSYTATIDAEITCGSSIEIASIPVEVAISDGTPNIKSISYNSKTDTLSLTVEPNGTSEVAAWVSIPSTGSEVPPTDELLKSGLKFKKILWWTVTTDFEITGLSKYDREQPNPVDISTIKAERSSSNPRIIEITWTDPGDKDYKVFVYVKAGDKKSNSGEVNIKSESTTQYIEAKYRLEDGNVGSDVTFKTSENGVNTANEPLRISLDNLHWDAVLTIKSIDSAGNGIGNSGGIINRYNLSNKLIYTSYSSTGLPVKDYELIEGETVSLPVEKEDINLDVHDPAWNIPKVQTVETDTTYGTAELVHDQLNGTDELYILYSAKAGYTNDRLVNYTYAKVREDIPALFGSYNIKIEAVNQNPVANDDGTSITDSLNAQSSSVIDIPASMLLANDTDREDSTDELRISRVTNPTTGTVDLITLNGKQFIRFTPQPLVYGLATFQYAITDTGGAESIGLATVQINIEKGANPPKAKDIETVMELTETNKSISLNVDNKGGEPYSIASFGKVYVNGAPATVQHGIKVNKGEIEDIQGNKTPYIKFQVGDKSGLKNNDEITFTYTVSNDLGTSTANVKVIMTTGDDPNDMEGYLYVHRKPIAAFNPIVKLDPTKTYVDSAIISSSNETSNDIDHNISHNNANPIEGNQAPGYDGQTRPSYSWKGLRAWEWGIKTISGSWTTKVFDAEGVDPKADGQSDVAGGSGDGTLDPSDITGTVWGTADEARRQGLLWIQRQLNSLIAKQKATKNYESIIVSLRVRDIDGALNLGVWSDQRTIMLTSLPLPPVAQFTLDKSTYTASTKTQLKIQITDMSYDPNGDQLAKWSWELMDENGKVIWPQDTNTSDTSLISEQISLKIQGIVSNPNWNPKTNEFTLKLVVTEQTAARLESDPYSVTFKVYKNNEPPVIDDGNTSMDINGSTVWQEDDGKDGKKGDKYGRLADFDGKPGTVNFKKMFTVTDDQDVGSLNIGWLLEGESVERRVYWSEDRPVLLQKAYATKYDKASNGPMAPFFNTVTEQGFIPGAYRLSVTVKDNPSESNGYPPNSSKTSYWTTYGDKKPYHLYVVPKIDMVSQVEFNGWVLCYSVEGGYLQNLSYRISDGKTAQELGIPLEDIVPTIGDTVTIRCVTNKFVTNLWGYNDYYAPHASDEDFGSNNGYNAGEERFTMSKLIDNPDKTGETVTWVGSYTIEDIDDAPEGEEFTELRLTLHGDTTWGSETGAVMRVKEMPIPIMVLPVKLYDFRVTDLTDPKISPIFDEYLKGLQNSGETLDNKSITDGVLVRHLAVDNNSKPSSYTSEMDVMTKGYSFYFKLNSKGLTKDTDEIRIYPKIYQALTDKNGTITGIGEELVGCVPDSTGKYQVYTHNKGQNITEIDKAYELKYSGAADGISLNSHREVIIPTELRTINGSEQTWSGRYGVPADARFFLKDQFEAAGDKVSTDYEWRGDILITFDIQAFKKGNCRYDYVERSQWLKERSEPSTDALKTLYINKEADWFKIGKTNGWLGSVIIYDSSKSVRDDYTSNPVWRE